jgi:hypothetical protein
MPINYEAKNRLDISAREIDWSIGGISTIRAPIAEHLRTTAKKAAAATYVYVNKPVEAMGLGSILMANAYHSITRIRCSGIYIQYKLGRAASILWACCSSLPKPFGRCLQIGYGTTSACSRLRDRCAPYGNLKRCTVHHFMTEHGHCFLFRFMLGSH